MCGRSFFSLYGLFQLFQICGIRVGERLIEVFDQGIQIGDVQRLCLHGLVPLPDGYRHLSLTHKTADDGIAPVQRLPGGGKDLFEVGRTAAKACGAKQEHPLAVQLLQKSSVSASALPLSVQKPTYRVSAASAAASGVPK